MKKFNILLVAVLILSIFTGLQTTEAATNVKVHFINVSQGNSIYSPWKNLIYKSNFINR